MSFDARVLIAGAGPTGLTLALWLTKLGVAVRIIDKLDAPAPYSRALGVQARTLELYRQIDGLADEVVARGLKVAGLNFWASGRKAAHVAFGDIGAGLSPFPFVLTFAQDEHERLLLEHLEALGVRVERSTELLRFEQHADRVRATLRHRGAEETCEIAFLAGCDGAHSAVRDGLGTTFSGGTYSRLFYVADVDAAGPVVDRDIHVELDRADLLAIFPMDSKTRIRIVGTMRDDAADTPRFEDVSTRAIERLRLQVAKVNWFSTYRVHHRVAGRFRDRRVFLLGDAAHIHSPVGAQGMNTGIGDAVNLAWKLAAVLRGAMSEELLDTYETERIAFARRLVNTTDRIFTIASKRGALAEFVRTKLVPRIIPIAFQLPFVRRFLFRTVSQIAITYRHSALSEGRAGAIHAGDRFPLLTSMHWQVHVYGDVPDAIENACAELDIPLHHGHWTRELANLGLRRNALYAVRPDSYVGFADARADAQRLRAYFTRVGVHGSDPPPRR
ncbi:MAG: FAD-dependent monooxygenase [Acidobacteria bacterium]|nr:FAD-dependent monooxygenase [Acidobacteriota bacterium]MBV9477755.1 FAD-dependent monooxygenase [Acidobacteriota bacterium]